MFAGLNQTGRRVVGPAADLVELEDGPEGAKSTALVYHERYRQHEVLNVGIELIQTFLEVPLVAGLVEMSKWLPEEGAFVFPTGPSVSVTEIIRTQREMKQVAFGPRAAAEVLYLAGMIFSDAADTGPAHGVYSHGSFGPQHLLLKTDGQVQIIGHGIPAVDVFAWREDETALPGEDTFRYSPPERLAVDPEDVTTDLFGLSLLVYELVTGEAVYDGNIEKLRDLAVRGDAQKIVRGNRNLPAQLRDLLANALAGDMSKRGSAAEFVAQTEALLGAVSGPGIADCMETISANLRRGRSLAAGAPAAAAAGAVRGRGVPMKSAEGARKRDGGMVGLAIGRPSQRGAARNAEAPVAPVAEAADGGSRWGKVRRDRGTAEAPAAPAAPAAPPPAPREDARAALRDRLKARQAGGDAAAAPAAPVAAPAAPAQEDARAALRDRLKRGREGEEAKPATPTPPKPEVEAAPAAPAAPAAADPRAALRERLRAKSGDAAAEPAVEAPKAEAPKAEAPKAEAEPADPRAALRDRLRQKTAAAAEPAADKAPEPEAPKAEPAAAEPVAAAAVEPPKAELPPAEPPKAEPPKAEPPKAEPPKAEPPKADAAPAGESLRDRLKRQREEAAAGGAAAPAAAAPSATPAPAPATPAAAPATPADGGDKPAEDPREALRRRLRERQGG